MNETNDSPADPGATSRPARFSRTAAAVVTLAAALLPALLWPGDTPWTNDEPLLISAALRADARHLPAARGLAGNFAFHYGPLPTHVYQVLLLLTHDPVALVALRAALCSGVTGLSLLWLARSLRLSPWMAAAFLLAPQVWLYDRVLWDATFVLPLSALAAAAYASFLRTNRGRPLVATVACLLALPLIHLQILPLVAAIGGHMLWRHRPALRKNWRCLAAVAAGIGALNAIYLVTAFVTLAAHLHEFVRAGQGRRVSPAAAALVPLRAAATAKRKRVHHRRQPTYGMAPARRLGGGGVVGRQPARLGGRGAGDPSPVRAGAGRKAVYSGCGATRGNLSARGEAGRRAKAIPPGATGDGGALGSARHPARRRPGGIGHADGVVRGAARAAVGVVLLRAIRE